MSLKGNHRWSYKMSRKIWHRQKKRMQYDHRSRNWRDVVREVDDRGWDGCVASLTQRTWVWANSGRQWRTGKPGVLQSMGLQRVTRDLVTEQVRSQGMMAATRNWKRQGKESSLEPEQRGGGGRQECSPVSTAVSVQ